MLGGLFCAESVNVRALRSFTLPVTSGWNTTSTFLERPGASGEPSIDCPPPARLRPTYESFNSLATFRSLPVSLANGC